MDKQNIEKTLANHEERIKALEQGKISPAPQGISRSTKQQTLRELVKGKKFKNGQQQIAAIVGYNERILGVLIDKDKIKAEWENAKITNQFSLKFIYRAKGELVRISGEGKCDLTQSGEEFFDSFLKPNV